MWLIYFEIRKIVFKVLIGRIGKKNFLIVMSSFVNIYVVPM